MNAEMRIPKSRADVAFRVLMTALVLLFVLIAMINLYNCVGWVASCIWLMIVTLIVWTGVKTEGGLRPYLLSWVGSLAGRRFVEASLSEKVKQIQFGFDLFGQRFVQKLIPIESIESVEWSSGQATHMAGRDMDDWSVFLRFFLDDSKNNEKKLFPGKASHGLYVVGPSRSKGQTAALGMSFVSFLRASGVELIPRSETCFVNTAIH